MALPHDTTYALVGTRYAGSLLDGAGQACANCGRLITQVGTVENARGERFEVGMDCAQTLSGIDQDGALQPALAGFEQLAKLRAAVRKWGKAEGQNFALTIEHTLSGQVLVEGHRLGPRAARLFSQYASPDTFDTILLAGCPELAGLPVKPAPTVYGTLEAAYQRGDFVLYQGRARLVMSADANLSLPQSNYRQKLGLLGVGGVYVAVEELDQLETVPNPATGR